MGITHHFLFWSVWIWSCVKRVFFFGDGWGGWCRKRIGSIIQVGLFFILTSEKKNIYIRIQCDDLRRSKKGCCTQAQKISRGWTPFFLGGCQSIFKKFFFFSWLPFYMGAIIITPFKTCLFPFHPLERYLIYK